MRCNNCGYKLNKDWKVCPKCGNDVIDSNLPFKSKNKEWIDKHLLLVNFILGFPLHYIYTLIPIIFLYKGVINMNSDLGILDINNVFTVLLGSSVLYPIFIVLIVLFYFRVLLKSVSLAMYASKNLKNRKYLLFIIGDIVGVVLALIIIKYFVL